MRLYLVVFCILLLMIQHVSAQTLMIEREVCSVVEVEFPEEKVEVPFCVSLVINFIPGDSESAVSIDIPFRIVFNENKTIERVIRIPVSIRGEIKNIYVKTGGSEKNVIVVTMPMQTQPIQEQPINQPAPQPQPVFQPTTQYVTVIQERTITVTQQSTGSSFQSDVLILVILIIAMSLIAAISIRSIRKPKPEKLDKHEKKEQAEQARREEIGKEIVLDTGDMLINTSETSESHEQ